MNRVIKFRGQDYQGKWHYGSLITLTDDSGELNYFILEGNYELQTMEPFEDFILVKPETVGQFTGLYDNNGKEIYEGDIVTSDTYPFVDGEGNRNYHGVIIWLEGGFVVETVRSAETTVRGLSEGNVERLTDFLSRLPEVIGNIHDNPELLEVTE